MRIFTKILLWVSGGILLLMTCVTFAQRIALPVPGGPALPPPKTEGLTHINLKVRKLDVPGTPSVTFQQPLSSYQLPYQCQQCGIASLLPSPHHSHHVGGKLTLREAVLLALRNNPDVVNSSLQRIVDKYSVIVAQYFFEPQFSATGGTAMYFRNGMPQFQVNSTVSLNTPIGTNLSFAYINPFGGSNGSATLTVTQPLLRGFGFVNRIPYLDTLDSERISRISFRDQIINVIVAVETSFRTLVEDYNNLAIQEENYHENLTLTKQYQLQVKVGKMSYSDLNQQEANLANSKLGVIQQEDQLQDDYQSFLASLGLVPNAELKIDDDIDLSDVKLPSLKESVRLALANNPAFQQALIQLNITRRAIVTARDARKPQLNVTYTQPIDFNDSSFLGAGGGTGNGTGTGTVATGGGNGFTINIALDIPINDVPAKAGLIGAEVAYEQAKLSLEQQKENLVRDVMTSYRSLEIQYEGIKVAETSVRLQAQTLHDARIKFKYGKITIFEVIQDQTNLLQARTDLVSQKIQYLNTVTAFYQTLGTTLDEWNIKLRY